VKLPIPKGLERRLRPYIERAEKFIRDWEWNWTKAFVFAIAVSFLTITTMGVVPSWWLLFADQTLGWRARPMTLVRDLIAVGWYTVWMGFFIVTAFMIQKIRRSLRGEKEAQRYSGGYR
jgi:hypothetical protein